MDDPSQVCCVFVATGYRLPRSASKKSVFAATPQCYHHHPLRPCQFLLFSYIQHTCSSGFSVEKTIFSMTAPQQPPTQNL